MTSFSQDTDSQSWSDSDLYFDLSDSSTSSEEQMETFRLRGEANPTRKARDIISQIENLDVVKQLDKLLSIIDKKFYVAQQRGVDLTRIPPLRPHIDEDGSVLLEWIFSDFRIGFNIEPKPEDSGWHLVSNKKLNEYTASGQLMDNNMNRMIAFLLKLIDENT